MTLKWIFLCILNTAGQYDQHFYTWNNEFKSLSTSVVLLIQNSFSLIVSSKCFLQLTHPTKSTIYNVHFLILNSNIMCETSNSWQYQFIHRDYLAKFMSKCDMEVSIIIIHHEHHEMKFVAFNKRKLTIFSNTCNIIHLLSKYHQQCCCVICTTDLVNTSLIIIYINIIVMNFHINRKMKKKVCPRDLGSYSLLTMFHLFQ